MNKKFLIILIIILAIVLFSINIIQKQNVRNNGKKVQLFYKDITGIFSIKHKEIKLTDKQQEQILEFYKYTDTKTQEYLDLAFLGNIKVKFNDGNTLTMDVNNDCCARYNDEYIITISRNFKNYILDCIE